MKKIIFGVLFLASILVISGCGVQESPYAMDEKRTGGGSVVTYQGVLDMLESATINQVQNSTINCDEACEQISAECIHAAFSKEEEGDSTYYPLTCDSYSVLRQWCWCANPP